MSKEIKATVGLMSIAPITDDDDLWGVPDGKFLVGFYLPIEQIENFRFTQEVVITVSEAKK